MIKVLTDPGSDLPPQIARMAGITVVPGYVAFGNERIPTDQITAQEVMERVARERRLPLSVAPSADEWAKHYEAALAGASGVVSVHATGRHSESYKLASQAAARFGNRVRTVDSENGSYALGLQALRAAQLADLKADMPEIVADNSGSGRAQHTYFMLDTLDHLKFSGRISGLSAYLGNLLGVKPALKFERGEMVAGGRSRGLNRGLMDLAQSLSTYASQQNSSLRLAYLYAPGGESTISSLKSQLGSWGYEDAGTHLFGPAMTSVLGPGAIGIVAEPVRPLPRLRGA